MYLGKVRKLLGHYKCFKGVTRKYMVGGGAESAPLGQIGLKATWLRLFKNILFSLLTN